MSTFEGSKGEFFELGTFIPEASNVGHQARAQSADLIHMPLIINKSPH
jgi:hypothetical protein